MTPTDSKHKQSQNQKNSTNSLNSPKDGSITVDTKKKKKSKGNTPKN